MLKALLSLRLSALLLLLPLFWFAWATATNTRILGDDNESTEELNGPAGRTHHSGRSYHSSGYYHK